MPLSMAPEGKENVICKIGGKEETRLFLERLGFVVGAIVTVISEIQGNLIVLFWDFEKKIFKCEIFLKGKIRIFTLLFIALRVYRNRKIKEFIARFKK